MQRPSAWPRDLFAGAVALVSLPAGAQRLDVTITAYNTVRGQTDDTPSIGACNQPHRDRAHLLAVSPDLMKLGLTCGTRVHIEGLGHYIVWDKMNARWRRRIDLLMGNDVDRARQWGEKKARIRW